MRVTLLPSKPGDEGKALFFPKLPASSPPDARAVVLSCWIAASILPAATQQLRPTALPRQSTLNLVLRRKRHVTLGGAASFTLSFCLHHPQYGFRASTGGCALPGGYAKNRAASPRPEREASFQPLYKAAPATVADQTGRSPPTTLRPSLAVWL
jgi:hypothetical protein